MGVCASQRSRDAELVFLRDRGVAAVQYYPPNRWTPEQRDRLERIMSGDSSDSIIMKITNLHSTVFDQELHSFLHRRARELHEYRFFWQAFPTHCAQWKVIRCQTSGLCYMHAPVVLQHYLVALTRPHESIGMIDVARYIKAHWKSKQLENYLLHNLGGNSMEFLREITNRANLRLDSYMLTSSEAAATCRTIADRLQTQPALVSQFRVESVFLESDCVFFAGGIGDQLPVGHHSMVLVGSRYDAALGEYCFVLQNWWMSRYFIEVTASYLQSAGATISFVAEAVSEIPAEFPLTYQMYAETAMDRCEGVCEL